MKFDDRAKVDGAPDYGTACNLVAWEAETTAECSPCGVGGVHEKVALDPDPVKSFLFRHAQ